MFHEPKHNLSNFKICWTTGTVRCPLHVVHSSLMQNFPAWKLSNHSSKVILNISVQPSHIKHLSGIKISVVNISKPHQNRNLTISAQLVCTSHMFWRIWVMRRFKDRNKQHYKLKTTQTQRKMSEHKVGIISLWRVVCVWSVCVLHIITPVIVTYGYWLPRTIKLDVLTLPCSKMCVSVLSSQTFSFIHYFCWFMSRQREAAKKY